jgi:hypothetical protein
MYDYDSDDKSDIDDDDDDIDFDVRCITFLCFLIIFNVMMIVFMITTMIVIYTFARLDYDDFMFMSSSIIYCIIESVASSISLKASGNISGEKK